MQERSHPNTNRSAHHHHTVAAVPPLQAEAEAEPAGAPHHGATTCLNHKKRARHSVVAAEQEQNAKTGEEQAKEEDEKKTKRESRRISALHKRRRSGQRVIVVANRLPIAVVPKTEEEVLREKEARREDKAKAKEREEERGAEAEEEDGWKRYPLAMKWKFVQNTGKMTQLVEASLAGRPPRSVVWIGWPGFYLDDPDERQQLSERFFEEYTCIPVWLERHLLKHYYDGFANGTLWPLFHYQHSKFTYKLKHWEAYKSANSMFAQRVFEVVEPSDLVWVHDYQLALVPSIVAEKLPRTRLGFFLHTPFPSSEIFRMLPSPAREEILYSLLSCTLVGFHTYDYSRHFLKACTSVLGLETSSSRVFYDYRTITTGVFAAGIDPNKFLEHLHTQQVKERIAQLKKKYGNRKILLGVDRMDVVKGLPEKLNGFQYFFERYPEWRGKVTLIQVALPSRKKFKGYKALKKEVNETVGRIEGKFASLDFVPVHYIFRNVDFTELCALYAFADAVLVTSLRDGENLVSQEYIICQQEKNGVVILSELTGAAQSLSGALLVNPYSKKDIAKAIYAALTMPAVQRKSKMESLRRHIMRHTASQWGETFVKTLDAATLPLLTEKEMAISPAELTFKVLTMYHQQNRRLLIFDYDGVLVPFFSVPELARPNQRVLRSLARLVDDPKNLVVVISGRTRWTMAQWFADIPGLGLGAEYGFYYRPPHATQWKTLAKVKKDKKGSHHHHDPQQERTENGNSFAGFKNKSKSGGRNGNVKIYNNNNRYPRNYSAKSKQSSPPATPLASSASLPSLPPPLIHDTEPHSPLSSSSSAAPFSPLPQSQAVETKGKEKEENTNETEIQKPNPQNTNDQPQTTFSSPRLPSSLPVKNKIPSPRERTTTEMIVDLSWMEPVKMIMQHFAERTPGTYLEEKEIHLAWHFRNTDVAYGKSQARDLRSHLDCNGGNWPIRTEVSHKRVEVGPNNITTALMVKKFLLQHQSTSNVGRKESSSTSIQPINFILYVGMKALTPEDIFGEEERNACANVCAESGGEGDDDAEEEGESGDEEERKKKALNSSSSSSSVQKRKVEMVTALVGKKSSQATFYLKNATQVADFVDSLSSGYFVY
ncbi:Trehalose-6-phosphate synthase [Balamuthia mandrillaris]